MQKHVNCGAFGSVDKITCHIYALIKHTSKVQLYVLFVFLFVSRSFENVPKSKPLTNTYTYKK